MMETARRSWLLGVGVLVTTFVVGALVGAAVTRVLAADPPHERHSHDKRGSDMFEQLDLTPEQRIYVDSILEQRRTQMVGFWDEHRPTLNAIVDSTRSEIREILTPAQLAEEERLANERRAYWKKMRNEK